MPAGPNLGTIWSRDWTIFLVPNSHGGVCCGCWRAGGGRRNGWPPAWPAVCWAAMPPCRRALRPGGGAVAPLARAYVFFRSSSSYHVSAKMLRVMMGKISVMILKTYFKFEMDVCFLFFFFFFFFFFCCCLLHGNLSASFSPVPLSIMSPT